jgi:hypothetical protein
MVRRATGTGEQPAGVGLVVEALNTRKPLIVSSVASKRAGFSQIFFPTFLSAGPHFKEDGIVWSSHIVATNQEAIDFAVQLPTIAFQMRSMSCLTYHDESFERRPRRSNSHMPAAGGATRPTRLE